MLVASLASAVVWWLSRPDRSSSNFPIPGEGNHLTVEVLNATRIPGLARATTTRLRRSGIDVVFFGTAADSTLETTRIAVRRGDTTVAVRVREVLGFGEIVIEENARLLLDVSVFLGRDAVPPPRDS